MMTPAESVSDSVAKRRPRWESSNRTVFGSRDAALSKLFSPATGLNSGGPRMHHFLNLCFDGFLP